jgi:glutathione synthase/RimK-type ligase-like ATP-grasp enzyme
VILLVSYPGEDHADLVVQHLEQAGRELVRIDLGDFPMRSGLQAHWTPDGPPRYLVEHSGQMVDLARADVVWWRRVRPFEIDPGMVREQRRSFAFNETAQAVHGMLDALTCPWMNPRVADEAAHHKPYQWAVAKTLGMLLPRTLVTTQPAAAREFIRQLGSRRVVFKAFLASIDEWRETRLVEQEDIDRLDLVRYAPVIFQEYIAGVDLRITVIGEQIFAAQIDARKTSYPVDMRMVVGEGKVEPVELPSKVQGQIRALQRALGLRYGAIDMRRTDAGEHYFLEVNPAGQWLFVERATGLPIARALADELVRLENAHQAREHRPSKRSVASAVS